MRKTKSLDPTYFDGLYAEKPDPWDFSTSAYEAEKYDATIAALGVERSTRGLEVGCSIGILTRRLAEVCDSLVATEVSSAALEQARARCADLSNIDFRLVSESDGGFDGVFDLIVLSEVVYYWDDHDLDRVAAAIDKTLAQGGRLLLVHYVLETDYPKSGDDAVEGLKRRVGDSAEVEISRRADSYRLDLWRRKPL